MQEKWRHLLWIIFILSLETAEVEVVIDHESYEIICLELCQQLLYLCLLFD